MKVRGQRVIPLMERLMKYTEKDGYGGCWNWVGTVKSAQKPYGRLQIGLSALGNRRSIGAHQLSYTLHKGDIPNGMCVCHTCDNPRCVNPDHLFLGTKKDNADDRDRKGRLKKAPVLRGEDHGSTKLTDKQVAEIRQSPLSSKKVAAIYGIDDSYVRQLRRGEFRLPPPPSGETE